ncbi:hypothetical protein D3C73_1179260 [compost metagenome]
MLNLLSRQLAVVQHQIEITQYRGERRSQIMGQIKHQLILAVLGKITAFHRLLQLAAGLIQIGGNVLKLIIRGNMDAAVEIPGGQLPDML